MPPGFDKFESFGHDELTAKHCYFRCSRPSDVDGIKIFDKDDQATKHYDKRIVFCGLVIFLKNFDPINIWRSWAPEITTFWIVFLMTKTFKPIKTRRHGLPIWFNIFFSKACFSFWLFLFTLGVFLIWFHFFFWFLRVRVRLFNNFLLYITILSCSISELAGRCD